MITVMCVRCGKSFRTYACRLAVGKSRFCSRVCHSAWKIGRPKKERGHKRCPVCGLVKSAGDFYKPGVRLSGYCKLCTNTKARNAYRTNPELREQKREYCARHYRENGGREKSRTRHLQRLYGITEEGYEAMLLAQGGVCALCKREPNGSRLRVEHDHGTKKVRGLVHGFCNIVIGWADRNPHALETLGTYIRQ